MKRLILLITDQTYFIGTLVTLFSLLKYNHTLLKSLNYQIKVYYQELDNFQIEIFNNFSSKYSIPINLVYQNKKLDTIGRLSNTYLKLEAFSQENIDNYQDIFYFDSDLLFLGEISGLLKILDNYQWTGGLSFIKLIGENKIQNKIKNNTINTGVFGFQSKFFQNQYHYLLTLYQDFTKDNQLSRDQIILSNFLNKNLNGWYFDRSLYNLKKTEPINHQTKIIHYVYNDKPYYLNNIKYLEYNQLWENNFQELVNIISPPVSTEKKISFIIPMRFGYERTRETIINILENCSYEKEILVFLNGIDRKIVNNLLKDLPITLFYDSNLLTSTQVRKLGLENAKYPWIFYVDNNVIFSPKGYDLLLDSAIENQAVAMGPLYVELPENRIHSRGNTTWVNDDNDNKLNSSIEVKESFDLRNLSLDKNHPEIIPVRCLEFHTCLFNYNFISKFEVFNLHVANTKEHIYTFNQIRNHFGKILINTHHYGYLYHLMTLNEFPLFKHFRSQEIGNQSYQELKRIYGISFPNDSPFYRFIKKAEIKIKEYSKNNKNNESFLIDEISGDLVFDLKNDK